MAPVFSKAAIVSRKIRAGRFLDSPTIVCINTLEIAIQNSEKTHPQDCLSLVKKMELRLFSAVGEEGERKSHAVDPRPPRRNQLE